MLINVDDLIRFISLLMDEYDVASKEHHKRPSEIKIRIDCVVKRLISLVGSNVKGLSGDRIIEVKD